MQWYLSHIFITNKKVYYIYDIILRLMENTTMYISILTGDKGLLKFPCIYCWQLCVQSSIDIASVAKTYASFQF